MITAIVFTFAIASCGSQSSSDVSDSDEVADTDEYEEVIEETPKNPRFGEWRYTEEVQGTEVVVTLSLNEDGTYKTMMNDFPSEGTWENIDDEHIRVKSESINNPDGQTWHIVEANENELHINWNVDNGGDNVLVFTRIN